MLQVCTPFVPLVHAQVNVCPGLQLWEQTQAPYPLPSMLQVSAPCAPSGQVHEIVRPGEHGWQPDTPSAARRAIESASVIWVA
jgi:hypothetical protein